MDLQLEPVSVFIELILLSALVFLDIISFIVFQISLELSSLNSYRRFSISKCMMIYILVV